MKKNKFTLVLMLILHLTVFGNTTDEIKITKPTYFSEFERVNFENYLQSKNPDILALSLSIDTTENNENKEEYIKTIKFYLDSNREIIEKTKNEKSKINKLFKSAHNSFFIQYDLNTYGSDFYSAGKFNCVTGSLFYSLILDSLNIPYTIKENPTHVFLLAYPKTFSLPVESTDPNMKIFIPDQGFKKRYVDFLSESKIIQKSEIADKGVEAIFNERFYSNTDIKAIELVGLLYYNSGINYLTQNNFKSAFQQFEKAYLLYPSERIRYALEVSLLAYIENIESFNIEQLDYLAKLSNYTKNKTYRDIVTNEFRKYTYKYLINGNNELQYEQIYNNLISQIEDSTVKIDISTKYFHERSRICSIKNENEKSWNFICQGYRINPKNMDIIARLQNSFISKLSLDANDDIFIIQYDSLLEEYPVLKEDVNIQRYRATYYLNKTERFIYQNNYASAEKVLANFENFMQKNPNCNINRDYIANVYCNLASAYYRDKNIKKCKSTLEKGLVLVPNNEKLIRKYKVNITHEIY